MAILIVGIIKYLNPICAKYGPIPILAMFNRDSAYYLLTKPIPEYSLVSCRE